MNEISSNTTNRTHSRTIIHAVLWSSGLRDAENEVSRVSDEVDTIAGAGLETSTQTLRFTAYHSHPYTPLLPTHRTAGLFQQPRSRNHERANGRPLERLPYLKAAVLEGLRLCPGVATRLARIVPDGELVYDSKWVVPGGTTISMTTLLTHWDKNGYPNARRFEPERWMD